MDQARANAVLVDGFPEEHQRSDLVHRCFDRVFPGKSVTDMHCARGPGKILAHWKRRVGLRILTRGAEAGRETSRKGPGDRPRHSESLVDVNRVGGSKTRSRGRSRMSAIRWRRRRRAGRPDGSTSSRAFVTFTERSVAVVVWASIIAEGQ